MKFEGQFTITKRKSGGIIGRISGIKDLYGYSSMEFALKDPHSVQDVGTIIIEIPDVNKPEPPKGETKKVAFWKKMQKRTDG